MSEIKTLKTGITENNSPVRKFFLKVGGVLAIVLHPVFLFFYCFLFIHFTVASKWPDRGVYFYGNIGIVFLLTVCLPVIFSMLYTKDIYLRNRRKRPLTILVTLVCYTMCYVWLNVLMYKIGYSKDVINYSGYLISLPANLRLLFLLIRGLVLLFILSFWFKISLHANGIGFLFAIPFIHYLPWVLWHDIFSNTVLISIETLIIICGSILLWQRVASGAHKLMEVISGFAVGFGFTILMETLLR